MDDQIYYFSSVYEFHVQFYSNDSISVLTCEDGGLTVGVGTLARNYTSYLRYRHVSQLESDQNTHLTSSFVV